MRPQLAAALAMTLTAALPAASASAAVTRTARFDVALTGSYSTAGVTTETGCFTFDERKSRYDALDAAWNVSSEYRSIVTDGFPPIWA